MILLSPLTQDLVEKFFPGNIEAAKKMLEENCGQNLPFCENQTPKSMQHIDWRDLLMWAEFGHDVLAHEIWARRVLGS